MLAWLTRTTNYWGSIASTGLTGGIELRLTVMPFILRGVSLIGIDSVMCPMDMRREIWRRLATDMKPARSSRSRPRSRSTACPGVRDAHGGKARGRFVVSLGGNAMKCTTIRLAVRIAGHVTIWRTTSGAADARNRPVRVPGEPSAVVPDSGGAGVPVVLLHARTGSTLAWERQVPAFAARGYRGSPTTGWARDVPGWRPMRRPEQRPTTCRR